MSQTRIDAYEVFYSANAFPPRIVLKTMVEKVGEGEITSTD